jgi:excisionase family DNA binding protein
MTVPDTPERDETMSGTVPEEAPAPVAPDMSLTTAQAATLAGVSPRTIRRWIEKGTLPAQSGTGGVLYVYAADVEVARLASVSRAARPSPMSARPFVVEDNNTVPDTSGASQMTPDPAGTAAGAILTAWRDTVLAPVVEELSLTRRELGAVRQELGRAEAERDQAHRERDALQERVAALEAGAGTKDVDVAHEPPSTVAATEPSPAPDTRPLWKKLLGMT